MSISIASDATPRMDLGSAISEGMLKESDFIASKIFPIFKTTKLSSSYYKATREDIFRKDTNLKIGRNGEFPFTSREVETDTYTCEQFGLQENIFDVDREQYSDQFDLELLTAEGIKNNLMLNYEARVASILFNTTTYTGTALYKDYSGTAPWDSASSDVLAQMHFAIKKIRTNTGMTPNTLVMSFNNLQYLKTNTALRGDVKYTRLPSDEEMMNLLPALFGIPNILIGNAAYNSSKKGQDFSASDIWSDNYAFLCVVDSNIKNPSIGRTFIWENDGANLINFDMYRAESRRADVLRARMFVDEKLIDTYMGFLLKVNS